MKEKIGVIARYTGLAAHTIKYYENMGLIDNVRDEQSNYRYYELNQRTIIHECMHYRKLDFPIKDVYKRQVVGSHRCHDDSVFYGHSADGHWFKNMWIFGFHRKIISLFEIRCV